jgi:hypothetical protein
VQYASTALVMLAAGATSVTVPVAAIIAGSGGNASANAVTQMLSNVGYPLFVTASSAMVNGASAETPSVTLSRVTAVQATFGLCSPLAIANACVGVRGSGGSVCKFANCYEPWIAAGTGAGSGTAGYTVYVDDGTGNASSDLISAIAATLLGNTAANQSGYRPCGVPWTVQAVTPILANVSVSGTLLSVAPTSQISSSIVTQINNYFNALQISATATQSQIAAQAADAGLGYFTNLSVSLYLNGSTTAVSSLSAAGSSRVILNTLNVTV